MRTLSSSVCSGFSAYLGKEAGFDSESFQSKEPAGRGGPSREGVWGFSPGLPTAPL